jgi:hypothetical protein
MSEVPEGADGKPLAKVQTHLEEKVGLANYSNVTYGASVTRFVEDDPDTIAAGIRENAATVESWMKEYFRENVLEMVENSAK